MMSVNIRSERSRWSATSLTRRRTPEFAEFAGFPTFAGLAGFARFAEFWFAEFWFDGVIENLPATNAAIINTAAAAANSLKPNPLNHLNPLNPLNPKSLLLCYTPTVFSTKTESSLG